MDVLQNLLQKHFFHEQTFFAKERDITSARYKDLCCHHLSQMN